MLDALQRFEGTVIFVSHDKFFIQGLATRILELTASAAPGVGTRIRNFPGTYDYYLYRIAAEADGSAAGKSGQAAPFSSGGKTSGSSFGKISSSSADKIGGASATKPSAAPFSPAARTVPETGCRALSYEEQKRQRAEKRKREKEEERIFAQLAETEDAIKELEAQLASPAVYTDGEKARSVQQQIQALQEIAAALTEAWEALAQD